MKITVVSPISKVGNFRIEDSITVEELSNNIDNNDFLKSNVISMEEFLKQKENKVLQPREVKMFLNGVLLDTDVDGIIRIYDENQKFIGIGESINGKLKRKIVLN